MFILPSGNEYGKLLSYTTGEIQYRPDILFSLHITCGVIDSAWNKITTCNSSTTHYKWYNPFLR